MFFHCNRKWVMAFVVAVWACGIISLCNAAKGENSSTPVRIHAVIAESDSLSSPPLWQITVKEAVPVVYKLSRCGSVAPRKRGTDTSPSTWRLERFGKRATEADAGWDSTVVGSFALPMPVVDGQSYYRGGYAVLGPPRGETTFVWTARTPGISALSRWSDYPFPMARDLNAVGRVLSAYGPCRALGPMAVVCSTNLSRGRALVFSWSGHVFLHGDQPADVVSEVPGLDTCIDTESNLALIGGIPGVANMKPVDLRGHGELAEWLSEKCHCHGAGQATAGGSVPVLCTQQEKTKFVWRVEKGPPPREPTRELRIYNVSVAKDGGLDTNLLASQEFVEDISDPVVMASVAPQDMELWWYCLSKDQMTRLRIGHYLPATGITWRSVPFDVPGEILGGYTEGRGGCHLVVLQTEDDRCRVLDISVAFGMKDGQQRTDP